VSQYHIDAVDPTARNTSHALMLELVGRDARVLDVGCSTGFLGGALAVQGCAVTGVEVDPKAAVEARAYIDEVVEADLNLTTLPDLFPGREFDVVVFGDVLEHLIEPDAVLRSAVPLLGAGGAVVISIPNVNHGSLRLAVLQGRWNYSETGLLDRTHLRFFNHASVVRMVAGAGLHITRLYGTLADPLGCEVEIDDESLPGTIVEWVRAQPDALVYQFVLRAEVGLAAAIPVPDLIPAVELPPVDDVHSARAATESSARAEGAERELRAVAERTEMHRHLLTLRDHAIGSEAAIASAQEEVAGAKDEARLAREEAQRAMQEAQRDSHHMHNALTELAEVKRSQTWRAGHLLVAPLSAARRAFRGR
jgi:2-polyprenyl-3-methyl-5-hydroxy-6-metoxy-1,4-benzoquinol methylase